VEAPGTARLSGARDGDDVPAWASRAGGDWQTHGRFGLQHGEPGTQEIQREDSSGSGTYEAGGEGRSDLESKIKI
jgi:hypothetical protein